MKSSRIVRSAVSLALVALASLVVGCAGVTVVPGSDGPYSGLSSSAAPSPYGGPMVEQAPLPTYQQQQPQQQPQGGPGAYPQPAPGMGSAQPVPQQGAQMQSYSAQPQQGTASRNYAIAYEHVLREAAIDYQKAGDQAGLDKIARVGGGVIGGAVLAGTQGGNDLTNFGAGAGLGALIGDGVTGVGQLIGGANRDAAERKALEAARAGNVGLVNDEPIAYYNEGGRVFKLMWGGTGVIRMAM